VIATLGFIRMISASMFSSLKNSLACAVATVKLGMFGFDAAMRTRSNAKAGCDSSTAVTNTTRVFTVLSRRVLHQRHRLIFPVRPRARKHLRSRAWSTHREFDHADLVRRASSNAYSKPYKAAGLSTRIVFRVVSSGANAASKSMRSPSLGVCPGEKLFECGQSLPQTMRSGAAAITALA
jgi:hypothetical protein